MLIVRLVFHLSCCVRCRGTHPLPPIKTFNGAILKVTYTRTLYTYRIQTMNAVTCHCHVPRSLCVTKKAFVIIFMKWMWNSIREITVLYLHVCESALHADLYMCTVHVYLDKQVVDPGNLIRTWTPAPPPRPALSSSPLFHSPFIIIKKISFESYFDLKFCL